MVEEFKNEVGEQYIENDVNTRMSLRAGFRSYKSEHLDYFLEHHEQFPLSIVLFYDADIMSDIVMRTLTNKIIEVFVYKYEKKFAKGNFQVKCGMSNIGGMNQTSFEQALSVIYEDVKPYLF